MYIEVIPSNSCNIETLTYSVPAEFEGRINIGSIVKIPFRKSFMHGLVINKTSIAPKFKTRPVLEISEISINESTVELINWIAKFYFCGKVMAAKLFLPSRIWDHKVKLPKTIWYKLKDEIRKKDFEELKKELTRSKKQYLLMELLEIKDRKEDYVLSKDFSKQIIKSLIEKEFIEQYEESHLNTIEEVKMTHNESKLRTRKSNFTTQQKKVFEDIQKSKKLLHLLHGVTGSGKTEVYLHLIHEQLEKGNQSLILLPEISLTPQTEEYFKSVFGKDIISIMHSGQTQKERTDSWLNVYMGKTKILIGARSALFAPFQNLGIIILDESHDSSFKQDTAPRYNAKRVAAEIAKLKNIKVIYGSATPNIETYFSAMKSNSQIELNHIDEKIAKDSRRDVYLVDMKEEWKKKNFSIFSELLISKIREKLSKNEQIILFVNRRGSASAIICKDCGFKEACDTCGIPLTYHRSSAASFDHNSPTLQCHHCGIAKPMTSMCPKCQGHNFKLTGLGTEKVEEEIQKHFTKAKIIRADSDTTAKEGGIKQIYETFKNHEADILIGTQMIAKGWDIQDVTLVGIVLAEIGLNIPDFRSSEKIFQLLTQVAGRTARGDKHGEVVIQTYNPDNKMILSAARDDYHEFYAQEVSERQKFDFPPFSKIIKLTVIDKDLKPCIKKAQNLTKQLQQIVSKPPTQPTKKTKIYLAPDYIPYHANAHHYNVFIQSSNPDKALDGLTPETLREIKIDRI
ncbi:MAG: primosomal protein N' [Candidatus Peregrinibacteria bacterium]|nr:primosomal protein N' [Candidatus Peregrinibacteria bacterium]MDZ4244877.1 primosomal protein N' [Candidatus Gracilibacteria bacterium]